MGKTQPRHPLQALPARHGRRITRQKPEKHTKISKIANQLDQVHNFVIDSKYEEAIQGMKLVPKRSLPQELECYLQKLKYDIKRSVCSWDSTFEEETNQIMERTMVEISRQAGKLYVDPFFALCLPFTHSQLMEINRAYVYTQAKILGGDQFSMKSKARNDGIIRIGYISSDFHHHSLSHLVSSITGLHNPTKFAVFPIHLRHRKDFIPQDKYYRKLVNSGAEEVIDLSKKIYEDDDKAADLLATLDLDILVDYNGGSGNCRPGILARKPAKVQVLSLIGFCGTSGNPAVDYVIIDPIVAPLPTVDKYFTEKGAFLPKCYMTADYNSLFPILQYKATLLTREHGPIIVNACQQVPSWINDIDCINKIEEMLTKEEKMLKYNGHFIYNSKLPQNWRSRRSKVLVTTCRKEFGLPNDAIVFANFNHPWKLDPKTLKGWMQILKGVKHSVLWQMGQNKTVERNMRKFAKEHGVAGSRLLFYGVEDKELHLRRMQVADVALDTLPFNGHTTTIDCCFVGIPLITVTGETTQGRVATSILKAMDLPQLISDTQEKAIHIAVDLGNNGMMLSHLKKDIQECKSRCSIFNVPEYVRNLEQLYSEMMKRYEEGKLPDHIILPDV